MSTTLLTPIDDTASIEAATRRQFLTALGAAGLLAGCGRGPEQSAPPAGERETVDFRYFDNAATVPAQPQRVLVIEGRGDLEFALSAGYPVIATGLFGDERQIAPHLAPLAAPDATILASTYGAMDYEEIAALRPDLIVQPADAAAADFYGNATLAEIAPVLPVTSRGNRWREDLVTQSELLRRRTQAEELVAAYQQATHRVRAEFGDIAGLGRVAMLASGASALVWTNTLATTVADDLGMDVAFHDPADEELAFPIVPENFSMLAAADLLFLQASDPAAPEQLAAIPTWAALPAVARDRVVVLSPALNNGFALTATALVEVFAAALRRLRDE